MDAEGRYAPSLASTTQRGWGLVEELIGTIKLSPLYCIPL
jgi:hypothetical protein